MWGTAVDTRHDSIHRDFQHMWGPYSMLGFPLHGKFSIHRTETEEQTLNLGSALSS